MIGTAKGIKETRIKHLLSSRLKDCKDRKADRSRAERSIADLNEITPRDVDGECDAQREPMALAAEMVGQDAGDRGDAGLCVPSVLGTDEEEGYRRR